MFEGNEEDEKEMEALMTNTFASQKRDVQNEEDTRTLNEERPYLFTTTGLKTHVKELTGVHIHHEFQEDVKSKRVLGYLKSQRPARESRAAKLLRSKEVQGKTAAGFAAACSALQRRPARDAQKC
ncbi:hypothetical protein CesoFtcFv8_000185 [Champsocephalus esox]|uniref:Uncharacterized protein n=1 Tax=Champsocephalus esox TaxID=159716 RepID=A0AAN8E0A7_9TELE|nr:hypothetical protein CesoFtcFv8_000185 [Champsocephalus esox]